MGVKADYQAMGANLKSAMTEMRSIANNTEMDPGEKAAMLQYASLMVDMAKESLKTMNDGFKATTDTGYDGATANLR